MPLVGTYSKKTVCK